MRDRYVMAAWAEATGAAPSVTDGLTPPVRMLADEFVTLSRALGVADGAYVVAHCVDVVTSS